MHTVVYCSCFSFLMPSGSASKQLLYEVGTYTATATFTFHIHSFILKRYGDDHFLRAVLVKVLLKEQIKVSCPHRQKRYQSIMTPQAELRTPWRLQRRRRLRRFRRRLTTRRLIWDGHCLFTQHFYSALFYLKFAITVKMVQLGRPASFLLSPMM